MIKVSLVVHLNMALHLHASESGTADVHFNVTAVTHVHLHVARREGRRSAHVHLDVMAGKARASNVHLDVTTGREGRWAAHVHLNMTVRRRREAWRASHVDLNVSSEARRRSLVVDLDVLLNESFLVSALLLAGSAGDANEDGAEAEEEEAEDGTAT